MNLAQASGRRMWPRTALQVLLLLLCAHRAGAAAVPARIDLDTFDTLRKTIALPNGQRLGYLSLGDLRGPAVVLIHGYTDSARDWWPLLPYLAPQLHLILIDLRGHGRSGRPECCYTRLDFAYDVKLLLDALGVTRADIVGHSLGSFIAQTFAEYWPEQTRRVVLISSRGGSWPDPGNVPSYIRQIRALKEPLDPDSPFMIEWWSSPTSVDREFLRRQRRDSAAIPLRVWLAVLDQAEIGADLQSTLPRLKAPVLLMWGEKDPIMTRAARDSLRRGLPQAQVRILPGLGHNPLWEDPQTCAQAINTFLTAAPPGAAPS